MRIDLTRSWSRTFFLAAVILCSGVLTFSSGKAYLAAHWNRSPNPELWQKAVRLEPGNAEYWGHVGLARRWDLSPDGTHEAVHYLQRATEINARSSDLWMELADAYQMSGNPERAQEAYEKARDNYPTSAEVAWRYGNYLLYEGKLSDGYSEIRRAMSIDVSLTQRGIAECWQSNPSVGAILDKVLPPKSEYYLAAIDFFLSQNLLDPALAVWNRRRAMGLPIKLPDALPLVDMLIEKDRVIEAQQTWDEALEAADWRQVSRAPRPLIFNGGFENEIMNGGFDWREVSAPGARFAFDDRIAQAGSRSFQVQFDGTQNVDFQNLFQYVPVDPETRYHFSANVRTEAISTDRGICFEIVDPRHPSQVHIVTPDVIGTNPWTQVQADVVTGPNTSLLKISLRRRPSWKFDSKLSGTVWVDDVVMAQASEGLISQ
jgi:tetratricopeptide (TPR) repeat protein